MQANLASNSCRKSDRKTVTIPLVELENVTWKVDDRPIINRVSWRLMPGQHTTILGNNGSGKTSLVRLATGYLRQNAGGRVRWQGIENIELRHLRRSIGWVSATLPPKVPSRERVLEFVASGRYAELGLRPPIRTPQSEIETQEASRLLDEFGCGKLANRRFTTLSQGEQQRLMLARALMAFPLMIILDEPCSGLDPGARERFLETLSSVLQRPNCPTMVMITHHIEEILPATQKIVVMEHGEIVADGSPKSVLNSSTVNRIYGTTPSDIIESSGRYWPIW